MSMEEHGARTLVEMPRPTRALVLALGVLAVVRVLISLGEERLATVPNGDLDTFVYYQKEIEYRTGEGAHPRVLLVGSSRTQFLLSEMLARELKMPKRDVGSYGFAAANLWTYALFLKRNPGLLRDCEVLVIEAMPGSMFRGRAVEGRTRSLFARYANFQERFTLPTPALQAEALADYVFPMWSYRNNPLGWRVFVHQCFMSDAERQLAYATPGTLTNRAARYRPLPEWDAKMVMDGVAPPVEPLLPALRALPDIVAMAPPDCRIVFWVPPLRSDFVDAIAVNAQYRESFEAFRREIESLNDPRVHYIGYDAPTSVPFTDEDFKDPDHFVGEAVTGKVAPEAARLIREQLTAATAS